MLSTVKKKWNRMMGARYLSKVVREGLKEMVKIITG